jgi:hypothetical protein
MVAGLTMIDRHYGHLARDGRDHAINFLDACTDPEAVKVDAATWTPSSPSVVVQDNGKTS